MRREELLSLRLHEGVAHKLQRSPELIEQVRARLDHLSAINQLHPHYQEAWRCWLTLELTAQLKALTCTEEEWIAMRQASPFAGLLTPHERMEILRAFRDEWAAQCDV
jgi:hypothetical protein